MTSSTVIKCFNQLFALFGMPSFVHNDRAPDFLSAEVRDYLHSRGVATSKTSRYNPRGNGQAERYNGTIWKAVTLALKSKSLPMSAWEMVLPDALHSIRSLLCTATNCTPHERMFNFQRKSTSGHSVPSWLSRPGPVYVRKHVRGSKYEPSVEEAELIEANPEYAFIRLKTGHETTVSLRDLAPCGDNVSQEVEQSTPIKPIEGTSTPHSVSDVSHSTSDASDTPDVTTDVITPPNVPCNTNTPVDVPCSNEPQLITPSNTNTNTNTTDCAPRRSTRERRQLFYWGIQMIGYHIVFRHSVIVFTILCYFA